MTIEAAPERQGLDAAQLVQGMIADKREKEVVSWAMQAYGQAKRDRVFTERQWYLNLAFYFGKHYVQFVNGAPGTFSLKTPAAPPWRVRLIINRIRAIVRHEIAKLTAAKPTFEVLPATTEDEDLSAARIAEQIFDAAYSDKKVGKVVRQAVWWASITGTGFIKSYWDSSSFNPSDVSSVLDGEQAALGDIEIERISPFYVYVPNLEEEDIEKQPYVIHVSTITPEAAKNRYGIEKPVLTRSETPVEDAFLTMVGANSPSKAQVLCLEVWIKPGTVGLFPEGGLVTIVGGKLVQDWKSYPYAHQMFPFCKIDIVPTGKFYGESNITDLIPLQREYNRSRSQIVEAKNLLGSPKLMAPTGSVRARQITSEPGQIIYYTPGLPPPTPLPQSNLPPYVLQELERLVAEMDDLSGQHEISRGNTPPQVTAATAISYLQEQDDTKLAYAVSSVEEALEKLGKMYLKYVTQYWTSSRLVRVVGRDGAFEAAHWSKNDLRGNVDIRVQAGSALPKSKAARQAFVLDLLKMGVIPPEQALEFLDLGGSEKIYEDYLVDKRQAERENLKMASIEPDVALQLIAPPVDETTGMPKIDPMTGEVATPQPVLPPNSWDNHQAHIALHNKFRKSQQFELLPLAVKQIFEQHVVLHQLALMGTTPLMPNGMPGPALQPGGMMIPQQEGSAAPSQPNEGPPKEQNG